MLAALEPPSQLYHGTAERFLPSIHAQGLLRHTRQFVHLSSDRQTATAVGQRHGVPVVLTVDSAAMHRDGYSFPAANINLPTLMVAERCSAWLSEGR